MKPSIEAQRLVSGFRVFQMVVAACKLKLPDLVAAGPESADELAASTGTHEPSLRRMLRGLAAWSFFVEQADGRFAATSISDTFRSDKPGLRNMTPAGSKTPVRRWARVMSDLNMMVVLGGRERRPDEYQELLIQAGLRMTGAVPGESEFAAIEAVLA